MGPELVCSLWECPFYRRIGAGTPERVPKHEWWPAVLLPSPAGTVSGHPPHAGISGAQHTLGQSG